MARYFKLFSRKTKIEDTRLIIERALRDASDKEEEVLSAMTLQFLHNFASDGYYKTLNAIRNSPHISEEYAEDSIHRLEKYELAMSLSRNLMNSKGEAHKDDRDQNDARMEYLNA